ncbi:MAG: tetrahydromethanopterin S-methyltransferase subunit H [Desulfurococcaceae archaeon]
MASSVKPHKWNIGGYEIGGLLGESPTWLVPTIFYHGDKLLLSNKGDFDKKGLRLMLEEAVSMVSEYDLVLGIDVVLPSIDAVEDILSFIGDFKIPIFIDSPDPVIRIKGYVVASQLGLRDLSIANGIYVDSPFEEISAIRENKLNKAVLVAFDPKNPYESIKPENRIRILTEKLLPMAMQADVSIFFVDAVVIDPGSVVLCAEMIHEIKAHYGFIAGCAPANALGNISKKTVTLDEMYGIHGGTAAYLRLKGADYIMIGPLSRVKYVAPVVAMIDGYIGYELRRKGANTSPRHPLRKLMRKVQKLFTQP